VHIGLIERLFESPLLADGAMGTYLHETGYDLREGPEQLVLTTPDAVRRIHAAYIDAGAELIETNTFTANRFALAGTAQTGKARELNAAAARLAREAAAGRAWIAGAVGPIVPTGEEAAADEAALRDAYREQFEALREGGVDALWLETFDDWNQLLPAVDEALAVAGDEIPVFASMVFADGFAASGETAETVARRLAGRGVRGVGVNCGRGLQAVSQAVEGLLAGCGEQAFVGAFPNAGYPERMGGRTVYLATPAYMARQAAEWVWAGVRIVGGCCGTTPDTIRAMRQAIGALRAVPPTRVRRVAAPTPITVAPVTVPPPETSVSIPGGFLESVAAVRVPVIAEIDPPPHLDCAPMLAGAKALLAAGAHAVSLAENPLASIRMENFYLAGLLRRETNGQVICHITGRDRNAIGMQSALMAAHAAGIEAVLAVTGDPAQLGGHRRGVSVYEHNSVGLVRLAAALNNGRSSTGRDLKGSTHFSLGVAFNASAVNLDAEVARLRRKQAEGARFVMTQPVFDEDQARRVLDAAGSVPDLRIFLGFLPPISLRLARYLHHEVPGIRLPETLLARLETLPDPADQERFGLEATATLIDRLADVLQGVYLITPGARWQVLPPLIRRVAAL